MLSATHGNSEWSHFRVFSTLLKPSDELNERPLLYARGTGANNHETAIIKVDDNVILDKGNFRGLYLAVFSRLNLELVYTGIYDTSKKQSA